MTTTNPPAGRILPLLLTLACMGLNACTSAPPFDAKAMVKEWAEFMQRDYVLRPGDEIAISVYTQPELTQQLIVAPGGSVSLLRIDEPMRLVGMSVAAASAVVQKAYAAVVVDPEVSLSMVKVSAETVYVTGEVKRDGPVAYVPGMTLSQAVAAAGGYVITAKSNDVRILRNVGTETAKTYRVDLWNALHDEAPDFLVLPGDVVFCQTSVIADVGDWITLHIARLLPFPPSAAVIP